MGSRSPSGTDRGFALLDALIAIALLGLLAVGTMSLLHGGARAARAAGDLDRGLAAARSCLARLEAKSFHELPEHFEADPADLEARLDTADGSAPDGWEQLVDGLRGGSLDARLEALGEGGVAVSFADAVALRIIVKAQWRLGASHTREVTLVATRF